MEGVRVVEEDGGGDRHFLRKAVTKVEDVGGLGNGKEDGNNYG